MTEPERVEPLLVTSAFRLMRITSYGHRSPEGFWYDQDQHEWVTLVSGASELAFADGEHVALGVGDACFIEARRKHRVVSTHESAATIWLALFFRDDPLTLLEPTLVARMLGHMNDDHADSILDYAQGLASVPEARSARMTDIDAAGFGLEAETATGPRQLRLAFDEPISDGTDARRALVAMAKRARPTSD